MTTMTALAIVIRHVEDPDEGGRVCRACGLPWPCDVRLLLDAVTAEARLNGDLVSMPRSGPARSAGLPERPRTRSRRTLDRVPLA